MIEQAFVVGTRGGFGKSTVTVLLRMEVVVVARTESCLEALRQQQSGLIPCVADICDDV